MGIVLFWYFPPFHKVWAMNPAIPCIRRWKFKRADWTRLQQTGKIWQFLEMQFHQCIFLIWRLTRSCSEACCVESSSLSIVNKLKLGPTIFHQLLTFYLVWKWHYISNVSRLCSHYKHKSINIHEVIFKLSFPATKINFLIRILRLNCINN